MKITKSQLRQIIKEEIKGVRLADVAHEYKKDHRGNKEKWNNPKTLSAWVQEKGYEVSLKDLKDTLGISGDKK